MAIPASESLTFQVVSAGYLHYIYHIHQVTVATDAVLLNYIDPGLLNLNNLRFHACSKYACMPYAILTFKQVGPDEIIMRNMATITGACIPVTAVHPRGVLGIHHMTVNAGFRLIG